MEMFLTEARIRRPDLTNGRGAERLGWIGGYDAEALAADSIVLRRNGALLGGERLQRSQWTSLKRRFCPRCFRDDIREARPDLSRPVAWSRVWWSIPDVLTCTTHDVLLKASCECGRALNWKGSAVAKCPCGRRLEKLPTVSARCDADRYVVGRLGFAPPVPAPLLDGLPLHDALRAIGKLAAVTSFRPSDGVQARHAAMAALRRSETGVVSLLERTARQRFESTGVTSRFGSIHEFARNLGEGEVRDRLLALMRTNIRIPRKPSVTPTASRRRR